MGRKKKFIEKGEGVKFYLVHRSQKDPLYLDENLGEHVLMPADPDVNETLIQAVNGLNLSQNSNNKSHKNDLKQKRIEEQQKFGIYYDDDYDYLQHLKEVDNEDQAELDEAIKIGSVLIKPNFEAEIENKQQQQKGLNLPSSVFASKFEEETGYFNQAAPDHDPKFNWDPDIVRLLDEDTEINLEDEDNQLEDDFFVKANSDTLPVAAAPTRIINQSIEEEDEEDDYDSSDDQFDNEENQSLKEFETKSRFSSYSMTSSVIRRNEKLKYLDEHFEKIYSQYDSDQIGALDLEEIDGYRNTNDSVLESALQEFDKLVEKKPYVTEPKTKKKNLKLGVLTEENESETETQSDDDDSSTEKATDDDDDDEEEGDEYETVRFTRKKERDDRLDCESVVSTYSNIYNRPTVISERLQPANQSIKLSKKTGLPLGVLPDKLKSKKELDRLDHKITRILPEVGPRKPDETKEEKKARKQEVKEHRRQRRVEKKINKLAFKQESAHQLTQLANNKGTEHSIKIAL